MHLLCHIVYGMLLVYGGDLDRRAEIYMIRSSCLIIGYVEL